jgi:thymidylate synthase
VINLPCSPADERAIWQKIFRDVKQNGKFTAPRDKQVLEVENYHYELPPYVRFCSLTPRALKLDYTRHEWMWMLRGDPYDLSILQHSNIWKNIVVRGRLNSNYGLAFFRRGGFNWVIQELGKDKDSRRACITILGSEEGHLRADAKDVPCTSYLNFRIRENRLNMSVHMRSQDAVYGMGNDAPAFSFIHEMVLEMLQFTKYPELELGTYHHTADSFHVYERHYAMLEELVADDCGFERVEIPFLYDYSEVDYLTTAEFTVEPKPEYAFSRWLLAVNAKTE